MTLSRSVLLVSPQAKTTTSPILLHAWCRPEFGQPCNWGTIELKDLGGKGYAEPYRTGGFDVGTLIFARPYGPISRDFECTPANAHYPFCDRNTVDLFVNKGCFSQHSTQEYAELSDVLGYNFIEDILCRVSIDGGSYYLYRDKSLNGVCDPGGYYILRLHSIIEAENTIYRPKDSYHFDGSRVALPVASGTTHLELKPYWEVTGSGIGFYKDTSYMEVGGYLIIGPNDNGDISICKITGIPADNEVNVTEILYPFDEDDNIYYWRSGIQPSHYLPISEGLERDPGSTALGGPKVSQVQVAEAGGLETYTVVESFIPIPWAIPAPYSIRNVPQTSIWLRLDDPAIPFNLDTLVFKINGENVTESVQTTLVVGGVELFYDPPVNFDMSSRVYVGVDISCSPSIYRTFGQPSVAGAEYITVSGDLSLFQSGGQLFLGPNSLGESEVCTVQFLDGTTRIKLLEPLNYSYYTGDEINYVYDDYPISINYYFDIVDDFRPPTFENIYPYDGMGNVNRYHWVMFDIKDEGLGVDISTLSFTIDNMIVIPQVYKYSDHWYRVVYSPPVPYYYKARVNCFATVMDKSSRKNRAFATWSFYTEEGETPIVMNPHPAFCAFPVHHKSHIEVDVFGRQAGANLHSMIFTWDQKEYKVITYPKIYRKS